MCIAGVRGDRPRPRHGPQATRHGPCATRHRPQATATRPPHAHPPKRGGRREGGRPARPRAAQPLYIKRKIMIDLHVRPCCFFF
ncbi:unnamed protein product, partial [Brenthis ino]